MSLGHLASEALDSKSWVPSAGQGSLVLFGRRGAAVPEGMAELDHGASRVALAAERACLSTLGGGADTPLGVLAVPHGKWIRVWGMIASADGRQVVRGDLTGAWDSPLHVGAALAKLLLARGAGPLMSPESRSTQA
jgi:hydroxymethylbilane synthase